MIGKEYLTYAQGAPAELVAIRTILAADNLNLPVSTTHVPYSGIARNHGGQPVRVADGYPAQSDVGLGSDTTRQRAARGAGIFAFGLNVLLRLGLK